MRIIEAETFEQRHERLTSYFDHLPNYINRGKYANNDPRNNVVAVLTRPEGNYYVKEWIFSHNVVTNDGDIYYAKKAAGESPAANENFGAGRFELRTGAATPAKTDTYTQVATPITASRAVFDGTYPKTNDTADADNTNDTVDTVSYRTSWTTSSFNATGIIGGCIHDNATPSGATKLLTHFPISSFDKSSSDTLKIFVNHLLNGV